VKPNGVGRPLPQNVQLSRKEFLGELGRVRRLRGVALPVGRCQDDKGLQDLGLSRGGGGAEEGRVYGRLSPSQNPQVQGFGNLFQLPLGLLHRLLVGLEEEIPHGVLTEGRELDPDLSLEVLDEELVGDRCHDARAVAVSSI